jgi:hypothetical protein
MAKTSKSSSEVKAQRKRASRKKPALSKTTSSKRHGVDVSGGGRDQTAVRDLDAGDTNSYLGLRQSLDSFQAVALYYYGSGVNTEQRIERAEEIKRYVRSFIHQGSILEGTDADCPSGTRACPGGDCVPVFIGCAGHGG